MYEVIEYSLDKLIDIDDDVLIIRLKFYLYLVKWVINSYRNVWFVKNFFLLEFKNVIFYCLNVVNVMYFIEKINIFYLEYKVEKV